MALTMAMTTTTAWIVETTLDSQYSLSGRENLRKNLNCRLTTMKNRKSSLHTRDPQRAARVNTGRPGGHVLRLHPNQWPTKLDAKTRVRS